MLVNFGLPIMAVKTSAYQGFLPAFCPQTSCGRLLSDVARCR